MAPVHVTWILVKRGMLPSPILTQQSLQHEFGLCLLLREHGIRFSVPRSSLELFTFSTQCHVPFQLSSLRLMNMACAFYIFHKSSDGMKAMWQLPAPVTHPCAAADTLPSVFSQLSAVFSCRAQFRTSSVGAPIHSGRPCRDRDSQCLLHSSLRCVEAHSSLTCTADRPLRCLSSAQLFLTLKTLGPQWQ